MRDETPETRGATAVLEQLTLLGTANRWENATASFQRSCDRPRGKLEAEIEWLGVV